MTIEKGQWLRKAIIAAVGIEYACIVGLAVWAIWYYSTGRSGDMPFELWLIPISAAVVVLGFVSGYIVFCICKGLGDVRATAIAWGALAAFIAPLLSVAMFCYAPSSLTAVSGFLLSPLLVFCFRRLAKMRGSMLTCGSEGERISIRNRIRLEMAISCIILFGLIVAGYLMIRVTVSQANLSDITRLTSVKFPPNTRLLNSRLYLRGGHCQWLWAKAEIDRADAEKLVKALSSRWELSRTEKLGITRYAESRPVPSWYNPDASRRFIAAQCFGRAGEVYRIDLLIDMTGSKKRVVVYIARYR